MGEVWKAHDLRLDRDIAVKFLPERFASDAERRTRFEREAKAVAALRHPNIVTIHSVEESDGRHFFTMEWVDGEPLASQIRPGGTSLERFLANVGSLANLEFLLAYFAVGGFFAALVFAISVVSVPMMLDRDTDGIAAALTSLRACRENVGAMVVWGALIALVVGAGFALWFAGLVVAVPVIGHATLHAYKALVA